MPTIPKTPDRADNAALKYLMLNQSLIEHHKYLSTIDKELVKQTTAVIESLIAHNVKQLSILFLKDQPK